MAKMIRHTRVGRAYLLDQFTLLPLLGLYLGIRLIDLGVRGQFGALFAFDLYSVMSLIEFALFVVVLVAFPGGIFGLRRS